MRPNNMDNSEIRRYLLGRLSDSDKESLEHKYFAQPKELRAVEMGEDELIDEYLDQQLSQDESQSFEQVFLSTKDRKEKLRLAQALRDRVRKRAGLLERMSRRFNVPPMVFMRVGQGAIAASLVVMAGLGWLLTQETQEVRSLQAERRTWVEQQSELKAQLARADGQNTRLNERLTQGEGVRIALQAQVQRLETLVSTLQGAGRSISLLLRSGVLRSGGDTARVNLPANALLLELQLELAVEAAGYGSFQAQLIRVDSGSQIVQNSLLKRRQGEPQLIRFPVGSELFSPGDYSIELGGFSEDGSLDELDQYVFRLTR